MHEAEIDRNREIVGNVNTSQQRMEQLDKNQ